MKKLFLFIVAAACFAISFAQTDQMISIKNTPNSKSRENGNFTVIKQNAATSVKNQAATGTCWSFSTTSLVESQALKNNEGNIDLSEMFTVRNIYIEKAKNYVLRQGKAQFGEGGLGHDELRAIATYGAIPETVYSGLINGQQRHNHQKLIKELTQYLDSVIKVTPLTQDWLKGYMNILDETLGVPPTEFNYNGKSYTPLSFVKNVLRFNSADYVPLTSFTHHPFYKPFILEVPDNFSNGAYYNLPLTELIQLTKDALSNGYTVMWDADVSNSGFMQNKGVALYMGSTVKGKNSADMMADGVIDDEKWDAGIRQELFENLTTQDDHLMHITGLEKSKDGKTFFIVKNSWGEVGPDKGYINVSEGYFAINTIGLIVPKAAISKEMLEKLKIK